MTDPLTGLRAEVTAYLRESPLLEGTAVLEEFPGGYRGAPPRQACKSWLSAVIRGVLRMGR